jgi:hypothetical protein
MKTAENRQPGCRDSALVTHRWRDIAMQTKESHALVTPECAASFDLAEETMG